ncbi:MAG: alpha/beta hydrolase [Phenylobacterium sp.]|nr:alpha/beta hydrolase [Phenylobacterium sp.]
MDSTAAAVADLEVALETAAQAYTRFAGQQDRGPGQELVTLGSEILAELGSERRRDAEQLRDAVDHAGLERVEPMLDASEATQLLGLGKSEPGSFGGVVYRVRRAEGALLRIVGQLATVTPDGIVRSAIEAVGERIQLGTKGVRELARLVPLARGISSPDEWRFAGSAAKAPSPPEVEGEELEIWFGTNRARGTNGGFVGARGQETSYGVCNVFVPTGRRVGSLGSGWLGRLWRGDDRVKLLGVRSLVEEGFWSALSGAQGAMPDRDREALVFLHGYRNSFEDAARRTAQLKADLEHPGPAAFFSWPSLGPGALYTGDEAAIEASEPAIRSFLLDLVVKSQVRAVHVIAHSMGNRALLRALDAIARDEVWRERARFGQIILAAPDVDIDVFMNLAAAYTRLAARSTLYVSENDQAIGLSKVVHAYPRAGRAPPVVVVPGIDTVNASRVNLGLIGHGYVAGVRPVLTDMFELIRRGTPPEERHGLRKVGVPGAEHWMFRA